ncbi:MAG: 2-amino-4-hydroxy-6-hydroxymethyldihydropteridine diphosphokinase [Thermomicrobiales bacterium]
MATALIGLGANLGDREETLRRAIGEIGSLGKVTAVSSLYESEPVGYLAQPRFFNAALVLETALSPRELMAGLLRIEEHLGRTRSFPNAPRTIDLDLLIVDAVVADDPFVTLPHPRLHERAFVLGPLAEIAPEVVHPRLARTIEALRDALPAGQGIVHGRPRGWESTPPDVAEPRTPG